MKLIKTIHQYYQVVELTVRFKEVETIPSKTLSG